MGVGRARAIVFTRQLLADLSSKRFEFDPRPFHVKRLVDKLILREISEEESPPVIRGRGGNKCGRKPQRCGALR